MLVKYRKDYEKVAMGLLSFIPDFKDLIHLQTEMQWYQSTEDHQLLLWRQGDGDFCGIIGIEVGSDFILLHHDSLSPEERRPTSIKCWMSWPRCIPNNGSWEL